jgi:hypothetical protein
LNLNTGQVYYSFKRVEHLKAFEVEQSQPLVWALDFNVNPMCSIVAQVIRGKVIVHDEIVLSRASTLDACQEFRKRFPYHGAGVEVFGDASGQHMQTAGNTDYEIISEFLRRNGYEAAMRVPRSNPPVRERISLMNSMLYSAKHEVNMFINPNCKELIKDLEQVGYQPNTAMIDKTSDPRRTHLSDALGYLVFQECRLSPAGEQDRRLL